MTNARRSPNRALTAALAAGALLLSAGAASAQPPAPTISSPAPGSFTNSNAVVIADGDGGIPGSGSGLFEWRVGSSGPFSAPVLPGTVLVTPLDQGTNLVEVREQGDQSVDPIQADGPVASVSFFYDTVNPTFGRSGSGTGSPTGSNGWFNTTATVSYSCSDPGGSGFATACPPTISSDGVFPLLTGPIADKAGNSSNTLAPLTFKRDTADPEMPTLGTVGPVTNELRPTFTWSEVSDALPPGVTQVSGLAGYRIRVSRVGAGVVYETPATALIAPGSGSEASFPGSGLPADLVNGASYTWRVQAIDVAGNVATTATSTFAVDTSVPNAPVIGSGPVNGGATNDSTPTFTWTGLPDATFSWRLLDSDGDEIVPPAAFAAVTTFTPAAPLTDGVYTFEVRQRASNGEVGAYGKALFTVDTVVPGAPTVNSSPGTTSNGQPSFGWAAAEQDGMFVWEVTGVGGVRVLGPGETPTPSVQLPSPLTQGTYVFRVRHRDRASNLGEWSAPEPFTIVAAPPTGGTGAVPTPPTTPVARFRPSTRNAKALTPRVGAKLRPAAANLTWKRARGATLYNIQIFRIDGTTYRKVHSAFPRGLRYKVPVRVLKPGKRYVWRVWPYVGRTRSYTRNPLGISWFDTPAAPRR